MKLYITQHETEHKTKENNISILKCTICEIEYKNAVYISAQSFGGSCIKCRTKYISIVNKIKKTGLSSTHKDIIN